MASESDSAGEYEVSEILRERSKGKTGLEYLVRWKGFAASEDSWVNAKSLLGAKKIIKAYMDKVKTPKKRTKSRSTSRSRSRSRGRRSPSRTKKASPSRSPARSTRSSRKSTTVTTTTTSKSDDTEETKTETVSKSPGRIEKRTELVTKTVSEPEDAFKSSVFKRTSETIQTTRSSTLPEPVKKESSLQSWMKCCCSPLQSLRQRCGACLNWDYPILVAFACVSIIALSFVLQNNVNFEKVWGAIVAWISGVLAWLRSLVPSQGEPAQANSQGN